VNLFKKTVVAKETEKATVQTIPTPQLVKEVSTIIINYEEDRQLEHDYNLAQVIGQDRDNPIGYWGSLREKLFDLGFMWVVKSDFVAKFKYAAQVGDDGDVYENPEFRYVSTIRYIGDMPDYAIERYNVARKSKLFDCFTVHSNEPLLVGRQTLLDPVLIGWADPPAIRVNKGAEFQQCSKKCVGVVIAIWDKEKELEVI
jgi:hypothetical protein